MRKHGLSLLVLAIGLSALQAQSGSASSARAQVEEAIVDYSRIKVGMTRQDVEQNFTSDGGMNFRLQTYYVYRKCDLIKVQVDFDADPGVTNEFSSRDKITKVSKLYLEYPSRD